MGIWGKIIGGMAGFAVGGPLGALLGAVAGHAVDWMRGSEEPADTTPADGRPSDPTARQMAFSVAVIVLGAKMAKADGAVSRTEVNAFKEVFRIPAAEVRTVGRIFDVARKDARGFEPYAEQVATLFRNEPAVLEDLLAGLFHIARADGPLRPQEMAYLRQVAAIFDLDEAAFARASASRSGRQAVSGTGPDPYRVLGLRPDASVEEIKQTYRRLMREHHPDAAIAKGLPQEFIQLANEKVATINAAYDRIAQDRGIK